jgi:hypothetical protein
MIDPVHAYKFDPTGVADNAKMFAALVADQKYCVE